MNNGSSMSGDMFSMVESTPLINDYGRTVQERFGTPLKFERTPLKPNSFGAYLRAMPLKPEGAQVRYYNGKVKPNTNVYVSVVDMPISSEDIQINADAVLRLKAEYLYAQKLFDKIHFKNNEQTFSFVEFAQGDTSRSKFIAFIDWVMAEMNTPDLCKDLIPVKLNDLQVGDIFIQKSLPNGHAVIVVDVAVNDQGKKMFLLAQSYNPAQEIQILSNPTRDDISPWYEAKEGQLLTPEWRFMTSDLMRFKDL